MKLYTLDGALLTERPEIRIGDKVYPVDDRQKTVKQVMKINSAEYGALDQILALALGKKAADEIDKMNMPFPAYQKLIELAISAMTGEDEEEVSDRFQNAKNQ